MTYFDFGYSFLIFAFVFTISYLLLYQFRLSTMLVKDHKHQCDRNVILRYRT
jgi:hypothetical protein